MVYYILYMQRIFRKIVNISGNHGAHTHKKKTTINKEARIYFFKTLKSFME